MENSRTKLLSQFLKRRRPLYNKYPVLPFQKNIEKETNSSNASNHQRGIEFEKFIVQLFDRNYFTLLEWRSDKHIDGISPFMNRFPDLEFYFNLNSESLHFAIECKWREHFFQDCIEFKRYQLDNYWEYAKAEKIPVFIVLGVGNTPSHPSEIYIVPLNKIEGPKLHAMELKPYQRQKPYDSFYLNCARKTLK